MKPILNNTFIINSLSKYALSRNAHSHAKNHLLKQPINTAKHATHINLNIFTNQMRVLNNKKLFTTYICIAISLLATFSLQTNATTFAVSNTLNTGAGSLRQAITDANADVNAPHLINFTIASGSTISLTGALPVISRTVVIDATTTAGYTANGVGVNLTTGSGLNAGLQINNAANVEIYGFQIYGFSNGILITGTSTGFRIGAPNKRNFINRCSNTQISIDGADNGFVQNNYIGCNVAGTAGYYDTGANTNNGIDLINGANNNTIGGTSNGQGNLIGGGTGRAFNIGQYFGAANSGSSNNLIYGNRIGGIGLEFYVHAFWIDGNSDNNFIGGVLPGQANDMQDATNGFGGNGYGNLVIGVNESAADGNQIRGNNLKCGFGNGIFLAGNPGSQGNNGIATPSINSTSGSTITGTAPPLSSVDIYVASMCNDVYGNPKGETYITTATATATGSWNFNLASFALPCPVLLTATATNVTDGTSAFSSEYQYCGTLVTPPVASFTASQTNICVNECVTFTNTSTGGPFTVTNWVFGEIAASTLPNPTLCFGAAGTYEVTLRITNSIGSDTVSIVDYITVNDGQQTFTDLFYPLPVCINGSNTLPDASSNLTPGGVFSVEPPEGIVVNSETGEISPQTAVAGFYTVYYTVEAGACGSGTGQGSFLFEVDSLPELRITPFENINICDGEQVILSATQGFNTYTWYGASSDTEQATITEQGQYALSVSTPNGCVLNSDTIVVTGGNSPVASFTYLQGNGYDVQFTNTSSNSAGANFNWTFNDTDTSNTQNPNYEFLFDNIWPVTLIVSNGCGADTVTVGVNVIKSGFENLNNTNIKLMQSPNGLTITGLPNVASQSKVGIYNIAGQLVQQQLTLNQGNTIQLPTAGIAQGLYFITIQNQDKLYSIKWNKPTDY
jgi:PKD repeat protein